MSVPITKGLYARNETEVFIYLVNVMGLTKASACGVLANIEQESGFNHQAIGDNGTSYGLCQWHNPDRWDKLKSYCGKHNLNPTTVRGQLEYLNYELSTTYKNSVLDKLKSYPDTAQGAYDAGYTWCYYFEIPADKELKSRSRGNSARDKYWTAYSGSSTIPYNMVNKGNLIVQEAKKYLGMPYVWGGSNPSTSFDCSGFTYHVFKQAINFPWSRTTVHFQWRDFGRVVKDLRAGDLIFFRDTYNTGRNPNLSHVAIATGNGNEFIHASSSNGVSISTLDNSYWKSHYYETKRLIEDGETVVGGTESVVEDVSNSATISIIDTYSEELTEALEYVDEQNISNYRDSQSKYGYLIDLVNGGEFKFYVPEYSSDIAANWEDIAILGRSASIKGYNSTSSRSIDISLKLFAGVGLYESPRGLTKDRVQDLHDDVAFVQSLAYPDYSKAIVLPPPTVLLYLGPHLKMKGVVGNVRVNYMKPYDKDLRPMYVELSFTVTHVTDSPPDYYDVRNHSFEGSRSDVSSKYNNATDIVDRRS